MGLFDSTKSLAEAYAERKARELQHRGTADTRVDDPINNRRSATFDGQEIDRDTLTDIRDMRESGGVISQLVRSKALMQHGTGVEWQAENEAVKDWLEDTFGNLDNLLIDLGEDAIWYPYSVAELVETRGGGFSHVEPIEPWTMLPSEDEYGEVIGWTQVVNQEFDTVETPYDPEEIAHFVLSKASARDNTGISEVKRAEAEIEAYRNHSQAVTNGIMLHGYPQRHVAVGREGGAMMDDNDLRRVRNQFDEWDTDTVWVTGADVDISEIEAQNFEFDKVTEHDLRKLALALGLPLELANVGSDGLGSGMPAELRKQLFERQARAAQRALADQFVTQVARPVLEEYSPFPADDVDVHLTFGDPVNSMESRKAKIDAIGEDMKVNERRAEFDMSKLEGDEGEEYESPGASEADDPLGGMFSDKIDSALEKRDLERMRALQEGFDANLFELVATEEQEDFETGARLGVGVEFPNSGVYVDWNIDAWPEEDRLDGPHVSDYATIEDAKKVAQGEVRELSATELAGDSGNLSLEDGDEIPEWDRALMDVHQQTWDADAGTRVLSFTESELPEFVKDRLRDAIRGGAIFHQFDNIPSSELMQLRNYMEEELVESGGWTIDGLANRLQDLDGSMTQEQAEVVARTETASVANTAREEGYKERGDGDERFYWSGNLGPRTTEACEWLIKETNPHKGGEPVSMEKLKELIEEAPEHDDDMQDNLARPENYVVHPNERKTFVRHVEG